MLSTQSRAYNLRFVFFTLPSHERSKCMIRTYEDSDMLQRYVNDTILDLRGKAGRSESTTLWFFSFFAGMLAILIGQLSSNIVV